MDTDDVVADLEAKIARIQQQRVITERILRVIVPQLMLGTSLVAALFCSIFSESIVLQAVAVLAWLYFFFVFSRRVDREVDRLKALRKCYECDTA